MRNQLTNNSYIIDSPSERRVYLTQMQFLRLPFHSSLASYQSAVKNVGDLASVDIPLRGARIFYEASATETRVLRPFGGREDFISFELLTTNSTNINLLVFSQTGDYVFRVDVDIIVKLENTNASYGFRRVIQGTYEGGVTSLTGTGNLDVLTTGSFGSPPGFGFSFTAGTLQLQVNSAGTRNLEWYIQCNIMLRPTV